MHANARLVLFWNKRITQLIHQLLFGRSFLDLSRNVLWSATRQVLFSGVIAMQDNWIISGMHARKANGTMTQRAFCCAIQLYSLIFAAWAFIIRSVIGILWNLLLFPPSHTRPDAHALSGQIVGLGWVDFDFNFSFIGVVWLGSDGLLQKFLSKWARVCNIPTKLSHWMNHPLVEFQEVSQNIFAVSPTSGWRIMIRDGNWDFLPNQRLTGKKPVKKILPVKLGKMQFLRKVHFTGKTR